MILCKKCGSDQIVTVIKHINLYGLVSLPGEAEEKALLELGVKKENLRKFSRFSLDTAEEVKNPEEFKCKTCGKEGKLEDFDLISLCRCGRQTDNLIVCHRYKAVLCDGCVQKRACSRCTYDCEHAGRRNEDTKPDLEEAPERRSNLQDYLSNTRSVTWQQVPSFPDADPPEFLEEEDY